MGEVRREIKTEGSMHRKIFVCDLLTTCKTEKVEKGVREKKETRDNIIFLGNGIIRSWDYI